MAGLPTGGMQWVRVGGLKKACELNGHFGSLGCIHTSAYPSQPALARTQGALPALTTEHRVQVQAKQTMPAGFR